MDYEEFLEEWNNGRPEVLVHTSGSTGEPKPLWVEKRRMEASARMTIGFLGLKAGDTALLCMPLDYIAGKMMVVRSIVGGMRLIAVPPSGHPMLSPPLPADIDIDFAAMVPLQVYNSLSTPLEQQRLRRVRHLIIGGSAIDSELEQRLRDFPNAVWSTYGMTETLSHIAMRRLNGPETTDAYCPLPGVTVGLDADDCLTISAPSLLGSQQSGGTLVTRDRAELLADGTFRILGRKDNVIISGGLKLQAEAIENALRPHLSAPFIVTRRPDSRLGQAVVLLTEGSAADAEAVCRRVLPRYWQPRHYIAVGRIPQTPNGKPARSEAEVMAGAGSADKGR